MKRRYGRADRWVACVVLLTVASGAAWADVSLTLTRDVPAGHYTPGATLDITVTLSSSGAGTVSSMGLQETLPAGWSFHSLVSGSFPHLYPSSGRTGTLDFAWIFIPPFPTQFTYRVQVPTGETGTRQITGQGIYRTSGPELRTPVVTTSIPGLESPVTFADANLEAAVRTAISKPTGSIYPSDLAPLTSLDAGGCGIVNLGGLENCTNLTYLRLSGNAITDIAPVAGLSQLSALLLGSNAITSLAPLSGLGNLAQLSLSMNQVSDLSPLAGLTGLTQLNLTRNLVTDVTALSGLVNLSYLNLEGNAVTDLAPLAGLTALTYLNANGNGVSDLTPLAGLVNLVELWLKDNAITDLSPLAGLTQLRVLNLSGNAVADLSPLAGLGQLTHLFLGDNALTDIWALSGLLQLQSLYLYGNQIVNVAALVANAGLDAGDEIDLNGNPLDAESVNVQLPALTDRGVTVHHVDEVAPVVTVNPLVTRDATPPLSGTVNDAWATISVTVGGQTRAAANNGDGTWTLADNALSPVAPGAYDVRVAAADGAGNTGHDATTGELTIEPWGTRLVWGCTEGAHSEIFCADLEAGAVSALADFGGVGFVDVAANTDGTTLYALHSGGTVLVEIDAPTLTALRTWTLDTALGGLSWKNGTEDTLYALTRGTGGSTGLYTVEIGDAQPALSLVGQIPAGGLESDLAQDPATGAWVAAFTSGGASRLWNIDTDDPSASTAGAVPARVSVDGLAFDPRGNLWAASRATDVDGTYSPLDLYTLDPATGAVGPVVNLGGNLFGDGITGLCAAESVVANGGFESGADPAAATKLPAGSTAIVNWTAGPYGAYYIGSYYEAGDGARCVKLTTHRPGAVSQTIEVIPGKPYLLSFAMAGDPYPHTTRVKELTVSAGGAGDVFQFDTTGHSVSAMGWERRLWRFTPATPTVPLTFASQSPPPYGPTVDTVRAVPVQSETLWGVTNGTGDAGPGSGGEIFTFDIATGAVQVLATYAAPGLLGFGDIAVRDNGEIYVTFANSAGGYNRLAKLNTTTWTFDWIEDLSGTGAVNALEFIGGRLLGVTAGASASLLEFILETDGASVRTLGTLGNGSEGDLAADGEGAVWYTAAESGSTALYTVEPGPPTTKSAGVVMSRGGVSGLAFDRYGMLWAGAHDAQTLFTVRAPFAAVVDGFDASATLGGGIEGLSRPGSYAAALRTNLLANGSFEEGVDPGAALKLPGNSSAIAGWVTGTYGAYYVGTYYQAAEGSRCMKLTTQRAGSIGQTFATTPGETYRVAFQMAGDPYAYTNRVKELRVSAHDALGELGGQNCTFDTTGHNVRDMGWETRTWSFVARTPQTTLFFASVSPPPYGPAIDDVVVETDGAAGASAANTITRAYAAPLERWQGRGAVGAAAGATSPLPIRRTR